MRPLTKLQRLPLFFHDLDVGSSSAEAQPANICKFAQLALTVETLGLELIQVLILQILVVVNLCNRFNIPKFTSV